MQNQAQSNNTFSLMIKKGLIYVDKTQDIYNLYAQKDRYHFLARPRKFGTSLLVSTLKELFSGNRELFKGLWIATSDFPFERYPIVHIDFSALEQRTPKDLIFSINAHLTSIARSYDIDIDHITTFEDTFRQLISQLAQLNSVVLLVAKYNYPLLAHITNPAVAEENQQILTSFYDVIKSLDAHFRAIFITGSTKYGKEALLSGLNPWDISENPQFATLVGFTEDEITHYFSDTLQCFLITRGISKKELLSEMKDWYGGYRFSTNDIQVYNPYSVISYLTNQRCANYWLDSETIHFLEDALKGDPPTLEDLESPVMTSIFSSFEVGNIPTLPLLYQAGYLTISSHERLGNDDIFTLGFPNKEIKQSKIL